MMASDKPKTFLDSWIELSDKMPCIGCQRSVFFVFFHGSSKTASHACCISSNHRRWSLACHTIRVKVEKTNMSIVHLGYTSPTCKTESNADPSVDMCSCVVVIRFKEKVCVMKGPGLQVVKQKGRTARLARRKRQGRPFWEKCCWD